MATIGDTYLTLADVFKQSDDNRDVTDIIEMLHQKLDLLADAPAVECNQGATHLTTVRTGLPAPTWRKLYQGVIPTKGTTAQVKDTTGMMEAWSEVDAELLTMSKNPGRLRLNQARAHIEGMGQEAGQMLIYGDTATAPEKFTGLAPRFNDPSAGNGGQMVNGGGTGSTNTTIWFVTWGENSVHLLYPEGGRAGLQRKDIGTETKVLADGSLYEVVREKFTWKMGLSVRNWQGVAAIRNVDVTKLTKDAATGADLIDLMIDAYYKMDNPTQPQGRTAIYTSRTIAAFLHKQSMNAKNVNLTIENFEGRPTTMFLGHPIRRMDSILETEAAISFA